MESSQSPLSSILLPPAYGVWRESNVFSLAVHTGAPGVPPNWGGDPGGTPQLGGWPRGYPPTGGVTPGVPPNWGGCPGGPPQLGGCPGGPLKLGGCPWVYPQLGGGGHLRGYPPNKIGRNCWTIILDKKWTKFWTKNGQKIGQTFWKLLEVGSVGGMPLAVTQEDCLVNKVKRVKRNSLLIQYSICIEVQRVERYKNTARNE